MKIFHLKANSISLISGAGSQSIKELGLIYRNYFCSSEKELAYCSIQWAHWMETKLSFTFMEQENSNHLKGSYYLGKVLGKSRQLWGVVNHENCPERGEQVILKVSGDF